MSQLPAPKLLKVIKGATFDYTFQMLSGVVGNAESIDLTGNTGIWTIIPNNGNPIIYTTSASPGSSGVFFGGNTNDPTNGFIQLMITASDTTAIAWTTGTYTFSLSDGGVVTVLLGGGIGVVGILGDA
jgi:hypothetical protein